MAARRIDWATDTLNCGLSTSTYTPNRDTHVFYSDITNEVVGTGYTAKGVVLGTKSTSYNAGAHEARFFTGTAQWTTATFTFRYAFIFKDTGVAATSPLIGYIDFGGDETVTIGTVTITFDATNGTMKIAA